MSLSMYQASVPAFIQILNNLSAVLDKAEAYAGNPLPGRQNTTGTHHSGGRFLLRDQAGSIPPPGLLKSISKIEQKVGILRWPNAILSPPSRMGMTWLRPSSTPFASPF
jgi:uncharacterized protein DUF1993